MVKASFFLMRLLLFIFIILMSGMLSTAFAGPVKADNGLIYCSERDITHMNPQRYNVSSMASSISFAVYDRLMTLDPKTKAIKNSIGSLERIYNNDTVYIFNIQEGIRFHSNSYFTPTRELNAYDVAFSFDRIINPNNPFYRPIDDFPYIAHLDIVKNLVSVKAISDHQVEFTVNQPTNLLLPFLATDNSVILSEEYAEKILEKHLPIDTLDHYAIGSGPYHQTDFVRGRYAKLSLFLSYHDKLPKIQKHAEETGLPEDAQAANDFANMIGRFEKKIHDLELTRTISIQMSPQIRMVQNNDTLMMEKIRSSINNTIPLWKNQMVLALSLYHSDQAMKAQREVTNVTNQLLEANAQALHQGSVEIAKESERGIVDLETLQKTNQELIQALDEVKKIQDDGRVRRLRAEEELARIEAELREKLLSMQG